ncbi:hypothetical protein AB0K93_36595, partial [Streptomyces sp. NPDC052676]|uniref:hypothetical protein n=1 Tax=Streptomyces sp. NPDC052676 TaxID=3154953 RepID=UPI00342BA124
MNKSSWAPAAVLAVSVLCAAASAPACAAQGAAGAPVDITASECIQGGGMIIIIADGTVPGGLSKT